MPRTPSKFIREKSVDIFHNSFSRELSTIVWYTTQAVEKLLNTPVDQKYKAIFTMYGVPRGIIPIDKELKKGEFYFSGQGDLVLDYNDETLKFIHEISSIVHANYGINKVGRTYLHLTATIKFERVLTP